MKKIIAVLALFICANANAQVSVNFPFIGEATPSSFISSGRGGLFVDTLDGTWSAIYAPVISYKPNGLEIANLNAGAVWNTENGHAGFMTGPGARVDNLTILLVEGGDWERANLARAKIPAIELTASVALVSTSATGCRVVFGGTIGYKF